MLIDIIVVLDKFKNSDKGYIIMSREVIAVDLDGTLAYYDGWKGYFHIGDPIIPMLNRIKQWRNEGKEVIIFTARAGNKRGVAYIKEWLKRIGLEGLKITNIKSMNISEFWDDRAVQVVRNKGIRKC